MPNQDRSIGRSTGHRVNSFGGAGFRPAPRMTASQLLPEGSLRPAGSGFSAPSERQGVLPFRAVATPLTFNPWSIRS